MGPAVEASTMSADEYLVWEELQEEKHEYYHGEIFAMGGARREHVLVSLNIASILKQHLRGTPCRTYMSDMKLRVETMDSFFYPDVMVSCSKKDHQADQFLSFPSLIVEVLSDSIFKSRTNRFDSFSKDRRIDVAIGDGEDITALAQYADMLLQFKKYYGDEVTIDAIAKNNFI